LFGVTMEPNPIEVPLLLKRCPENEMMLIQKWYETSQKDFPRSDGIKKKK